MKHAISRLPLDPAPDACALPGYLCVDNHRQHRRWSAVSTGQLPDFERYLSRLGVGGFALALGVGPRGVDRWLMGTRPDKAVVLATRLQLLVVHELEAAGRCGCKACLPSSRERLRARLDERGQHHPDRMRPGAAVWCQGTLQPLEVTA